MSALIESWAAVVFWLGVVLMLLSTVFRVIPFGWFLLGFMSACLGGWAWLLA